MHNGLAAPEPLYLAAIALHFAGMMLIAFSFCRIAAAMHMLSVAGKIRRSFLSGTRLLYGPTLIVLGGSGYVFLSFAFAYFALHDQTPGLRLLGTAASLAGGILALGGMLRVQEGAPATKGGG